MSGRMIELELRAPALPSQLCGEDVGTSRIEERGRWWVPTPGWQSEWHASLVCEPRSRAGLKGAVSRVERLVQIPGGS